MILVKLDDNVDDGEIDMMRLAIIHHFWTHVCSIKSVLWYFPFKICKKLRDSKVKFQLSMLHLGVGKLYQSLERCEHSVAAWVSLRNQCSSLMFLGFWTQYGWSQYWLLGLLSKSCFLAQIFFLKSHFMNRKSTLRVLSTPNGWSL